MQVWGSLIHPFSLPSCSSRPFPEALPVASAGVWIFRNAGGLKWGCFAFEEAPGSGGLLWSLGVLQGAGVAGTGDSTCRQTGDSRENAVCISFPWHLSLLGTGMSDQNVSQPQELEFVRLREWLC